MTSTISSNKERHPFLSVYLWSLRRHMGVGILYSILLFLALPVATFLAYSSINYNTVGVQFLEISFFRILFTSLATPLVLLFTLIISVKAFTYQHKKRSVDLYGTLPVKRNTMLCAQYLSALTIIVVPMLVITLVTATCFRYTTFNSNLTSSIFYLYPLYLTIAAVACLTFSMFCAVCSGTVFDMVVSIIFINIVYPITVFLLSSFVIYMLPGFSMPTQFYGTLVTALCPFGSVFVSYNPTPTEAVFFFPWWGFAIAALFAASLMLNRKRRSESAETSFAYKAPAYTIRFIATLSAGIAFGWLFSSIGGDGTPGGDRTPRNAFGFIAGLLIGSFVCHLVLEAIYARGFKGLKKSLIYYGAAMLASVVLYLSLVTGCFGYVTRVPVQDSVSSVTISNMNFSMHYGRQDPITLETPESIQNVTELHSCIIQLDTMGRQSLLTSYGGPGISYQLKNGKVLTRSYNAYLVDPPTADAYAAILSSQEYKEKAYMIFRYGADDIAQVSYSGYDDDANDFSYNIAQSKESLTELIEALKTDILAMDEKAIKAYWQERVDRYSGTEKQAAESTLQFSYREKNRFGEEIYEGFDIPSFFENTRRVMEKYNWNTPSAS